MITRKKWKKNWYWEEKWLRRAIHTYIQAEALKIMQKCFAYLTWFSNTTEGPTEASSTGKIWPLTAIHHPTPRQNKSFQVLISVSRKILNEKVILSNSSCFESKLFSSFEWLGVVFCTSCSTELSSNYYWKLRSNRAMNLPLQNLSRRKEKEEEREEEEVRNDEDDD